MAESNVSNDNIKQLLQDLFEEAKNKDESEYCCALLRIKGLQAEGWNTLEESYAFLTQTISSMNAAKDNGSRIRCLLQAYCHATEMSFLYDMVANMIQIANGELYHTSWFSAESKPTDKVAQIKKFSKKNEQAKKVAKILENMLKSDIRNAFNHSDYILYKDELRIYTKDPIFKKHNNHAKAYKLKDIVPTLEKAVNFVLTLLDVTVKEVRSYKANKKVPSRMLEGDPHCKIMELLTHPDYGLIGMRGVVETGSKPNHPLHNTESLT